MKKRALLIAILVCIFVFRLNPTYAASELELWCLDQGETWNVGSSTCEVYGDTTVLESESLLILLGETLECDDCNMYNNGDISNLGTMYIAGETDTGIYNNGSIYNEGTIENDWNFHNNGDIYNEGILENDSMFYNENTGNINNNDTIIIDEGWLGNYGTISNYGDINNYWRIHNHGTVYNYGNIVNLGDTINNDGTINNWGVINSYVTIYNYDFNGVDWLEGIINNHGTINNYDTIYNGVEWADGTINNWGAIFNDGDIYNDYDGIIYTYCKGIYTGIVPNGNPIIYVACILYLPLTIK